MKAEENDLLTRTDAGTAMGELMRDVYKRQLPALHFGCSSSLERQPTIRGEIPNSNPFEINKLPAHARAVAGEANRHF